MIKISFKSILFIFMGYSLLSMIIAVVFNILADAGINIYIVCILFGPISLLMPIMRHGLSLDEPLIFISVFYVLSFFSVPLMLSPLFRSPSKMNVSFFFGLILWLCFGYWVLLY